MAVDPAALDSPRLSRSALRPLVGSSLKLSPTARYGVAIAAAAATMAFMGLRLWMDPGWGRPFSFLMCVPAIMLSGWVGGLGPGILTTLICATATYYWLLAPPGSWLVHDKSELFGIVLLVAVGTVISLLNEAWRRSVAAVERSEQQLRSTLQREREAQTRLQRTADELRGAAEQLRIAVDGDKRTERVLRARTEELERVLEVIPASVWIAKDPECREVIGNQSAALMLKVPAEQNVSQTPLPGAKVWPLRFLREGRELSPDRLPLHLAAATGQPQRPEELEVELSDGSRITMIGSAAPLLDEHGHVRGAVAAFSDITERKQADRQKDEFLALLGHELRNPLSPIGTAAELLSRTLPADSRSQLALDIIRRQAAQLTRLVDDLLDIGRITRGRIRLQQMPLEVSGVIAQAVETVEPKLRQKQHDIAIHGSQVPLYVQGDFARLVQCVANVLTNAARYTTSRGDIRIETRAQGDAVVIRVSDNGIGISPELLPRVFDAFVQGDRTLDRAEGGLGIGLSVVKRLVQMHGGDVRAESAGPGKGTTLEIRLPRIAPPAGSRSATSTPLGASPRRILVVDDNCDAAESLAMLLRTVGHQVEVALEGSLALQSAACFQPEVALVDIGLPGIDGYELARRLRADPGSKGIKLIAVTGYGQIEDRQRARAAGFDHHLLKPVDLNALDGVLRGSPAQHSEAVLQRPV